MKRTQIMLILLICFICVFQVQLCGAETNAGSASQEALLQEPVVEKDNSASTGQVTSWSCISFGTYPQTEIIPAPSHAVDEYAVQKDDFLVDPDLYAALQQADWNDDETEIDGIRYCRLGRDAAVDGSEESAGHYRWGQDDEWHYFRYDPVKWRVIGLDEGKAFLMADKLLDCQPYHTETGPVTWEMSTVRSWLNGLDASENTAKIDYQGKGFLDKAFSEEERAAILPTMVENRPNAHYGTDCGHDTNDHIFLLSNDEVFGSDIAAGNGFYASTGKDDPAKRFKSTMYAKCRGAWWSPVNGYRGNSFWFMRTNGYTQESVTYICDFGYIYQRGTISTCEDAGLLPAMWISLDNAPYELAGVVRSSDIQKDAGSDDLDHTRSKDQIKNPVVTQDPEQPDGKTVEYSLVSFGNYPQSEVVPDQAMASADSIVDPELYDALSHADWKGSELDHAGIRYLRVTSLKDDENGRARYFAFEPLVWRVLEVRDGTALLLSDMAVDCEPFQTELKDVSWEDCTLRSYLNGYGTDENILSIDFSGENHNFLDMAFSPDEQDAILTYPVRNEDNYYFGTDCGDETSDKIFIPAESELFIYDSSVIHGFSPRDAVADRARQFQPTDYAVWKGAWSASQEDVQGNVFWITRTMGYTRQNVVYIDESGCMFNRGILATCPDAAVIPALILDLDSSVYGYVGTCTIAEK